MKRAISNFAAACIPALAHTGARARWSYLESGFGFPNRRILDSTCWLEEVSMDGQAIFAGFAGSGH